MMDIDVYEAVWRNYDNYQNTVAVKLMCKDRYGFLDHMRHDNTRSPQDKLFLLEYYLLLHDIHV